MKNPQTSASDILDELQTLVNKAEKLISSNVKSDSTISHIKERLHDSGDQISELYTDAKKQVIAGAKCTNTAIHDKPYQSIAIAAGVGVLVGVIVGRCKCAG